MELDSQSSSSSSVTKTNESSSSDHHHQYSDSINDQLNSLSTNETKIDDRVNGNNDVEIRDSVEETKSVPEEGNNGVDGRDSVEDSKSASNDGKNSVGSRDSVEEPKSVADDGNNGVEIVDSAEVLKSVADDGNNGVEIGVSVEAAKIVSDDGKNGVEFGNCEEKMITASEFDNNGVDDGNCDEEKKGVSDDGNNSIDIIDWAEEVKGFSDNDGNNGEWKSGSEIGDEKEEIGDEISKNEETDRESNRRRSSKYPIRPDAEDCSFYLRTGACKFGMNCKFNHPLNQRKLFQGVRVKTKEEGVDSANQKLKEKDEEQIDCKYFDRPGGCKFGKACKFNHSRKSNPVLKLNFMGLPIRMGEKECPFYMRNGSCKYGGNCRFNHPDPTTIGVPDALPRYNNGGSLFSPNVSQSAHAPWSPPTALNENPSYMPLMFSTTQAVPPQPEWNRYQAPVYPPERSIQMPLPYAMNRQLLDRPENMQSNQNEFPERPGQPECSYFIKTGDCKYKSACKFHHPKTAVAHSSSCLLSDACLPLRPGEIVCNYYNRYGICKYGPACKYDHPINHAHSSDLTVSVSQQ